MTELDENIREKSDIPITGRFDQYRSSYWAAAVAILGLRYAPRPFLRKHWNNPEAGHFNKHKYAGFAGMVMQGVTAFYAEHTWKDMKSIFSQTLAWEFDKDPKDVTFTDFRNSKNTIIQQTTENYIRYNLRRFAVNTAFFTPFILQPFFKNKAWFKNLHAEDGVDLGMGANAVYLFSDVLSRKMTPFEEIQSLIDRKINQSDHFADQIDTQDLLDIYERHAAGGGVRSFLGKRGTEQWNEAMQLFDRMADLMNQTHKNVVPHEKADFSFSKYIYLVGNGLVEPERIDQSLALVEIANTDGIGAVKKAHQKMKDGMTLDKVMEEYSITLPEVKSEPLAVKPSTVLKAPIFMQASASDKPMNLNEKLDMHLAYQDKIRNHQQAMPSEGLVV